MAVNFNQKLASFKVKPAENREGIILPQAFIATTLKPLGRVPANAQVIVERTALGAFALTWYDELDRPVYQTTDKDSGAIDITDVYEQARVALLGAVPLDDLYAEIRRREDAEKSEKEAAR